jgi:CDP-diacylglycerol--serine O-phosphatidyltransferase
MPSPRALAALPFHPDRLRDLERTLGQSVPLHPHALSLLKLALVWPIALTLTNHALSSASRALLVALLFLCFGLLDYLDGLVARERGLTSALGRVLDRATDLPILLLLSARAAEQVPALPIAIKLGFDLLLLVLYARGLGSTKNRMRTTASYVSLFALLMLGQGWGAPVVNRLLVTQLLWLNAGISFAVVLRRLGVLGSKRIADALSLANLACGLMSMSFAARGELSVSLLLLALGAGLDGLDGAAARRWGGSALGVYMDDIADGVSYGLAPGYAIYAVLGGLEGALIGVLYACFVIARLVFFTLDKSASDPNLFRGVPSTVGAIVTLCVLVLMAEHALAVGFFVGVACALMVSFDVRHRHLGHALAAREVRAFALVYVLAIALGAALGGLELTVALVLASSLTYGFLPSLLAFRRVLTGRAQV